MIVDDVEGFLKFLDDVSYQLACLLDIDEPRQQRSGSGIGGTNNTINNNNTTTNTTKKVYKRRKDSQTTKSRSNNKSKHLISNANSITNKRQSNKLQQSTRAKGKRKVAKLDELLNDINVHHTNNNNCQNLSTSSTNNDPDALVEQNQQHQLMQHQAQQQQHTIQSSLDRQQQSQQHQTNKLQQQQQHSASNINQTNLDTHTLDGQLTLNIADELPLDHVASISPTTHLSPIDSTIQFNNLHSQHYYTPPQRGVGHLDSYHLHDDFNSSHDQIPITNQTQHLGQEQHRQHIVNHQHLINHHAQSTSTLRVDTLSDATTGLNSNDCYQHPHHIHHHHHSHTPQYHQLDQQWLAPTPHGSDNTLQLGQADSGTLDHVVSISPTSHQSLDQVQFNTPIYHHSYYNHQVEQLDSFHQMTDDYVTNPGSSIAVSSSSPSNHTHRMQQDQHQHQQQHHQSHNQHSNVLRMSSLDLNNGNNINSNSNNNNNNGTYDQHQLQHHQHQHNERQHHHQQQQQHTLVHSESEHQIHGLNQSNYHNNETSHHLHNQHLHHQQQNQMMPLINGLVEPSGVIIQDINLASATWSSPEDLYSI